MNKSQPKLRILFAEHLPDRLKTLSASLRDALEADHSATIESVDAEKVVDALQFLHSGRYDVVVTDWLWTPDVDPEQPETLEGGRRIAERAKAEGVAVVVVVTRERSAKGLAELDDNVDIAVLWEDIFEGFEGLAAQIARRLGVSGDTRGMNQMDRRQIFVVYGHDPDALKAFSEFLEDLDLRVLTFKRARAETIQTMRAKDRGRVVTTLDVVQHATRSAGAILCLLTPDEVARPRKGTTRGRGEHRPRPNVIFEAGLAMMERPEATLLVKVGPMKNWSDVDGVQYAKFSNVPEDRQELVEWLEALDLQVDSRKTKDWETKDYGLEDDWS